MGSYLHGNPLQRISCKELKMICEPRIDAHRQRSPFNLTKAIYHPEFFIASPRVLDLDLTKARILSLGIFPLWERVNVSKHKIEKIRAYWSKKPLGDDWRRMFVEITSSLRGKMSKTQMHIWICPASSPNIVNVWYGPTQEYYEFTIHPSECECE